MVLAQLEKIPDEQWDSISTFTLDHLHLLHALQKIKKFGNSIYIALYPISGAFSGSLIVSKILTI